MSAPDRNAEIVLVPHLRHLAALSDGEVVARVLAGDKPLFELIMRRYNRRLFRAAWGILKDPEAAEDAVQEGYLIAFSKLEQIRDPERIGAWLTRTVVRLAMAQARTTEREQRRDPDDLTGGVTNEAVTRAARSEVAQLVEKALRGLPMDYRLVFILREMEELSTEETAKSLDLPVGTVKSRLHRAKDAMKTLLDEQHGIRPDVLHFAGRRCDRVVARVFARLQNG